MLLEKILTKLDRVWNRRLSGIPGAIAIIISILINRFRDIMMITVCRGNLGYYGNKTTIQEDVKIRYPGNIMVGKRTKIASGTEIFSETEKGRCIIGDDCIVGKNVHLDFSGGLEIEDNVVISEGVVLYTHDHGKNPKSVAKATPLKIGRNTWVGSYVVIIEGVSRIGSGVIIGAGAVVTKEVVDDVIVAGVPARVIRSKI